MIRWLMTSFFASILLSCSVARYIAAYVLRVCLSFCLCLSWLHAFWKKITRVYERESSVVSKETSSWIPALQLATYWREDKKKLRQFVRKMGEKKKKQGNISTSDQRCFNVVGQRWNKVGMTSKMKQNPNSAFQRCTTLIQRRTPIRRRTRVTYTEA